MNLATQIWISRLKAMLLLPLFIGLVALAPRTALAQSTQTSGELFKIFKTVPGLSDLPVSDIRRTGTSKSAKVTLRGKSARVSTFKIEGTSMGAFMPDNFSLADVVPIPHGTPIDGITFKDIVFIYVPIGKAKSNIATSSFPSDVRKSLSHAGSHINLKVGLNLFGEADFASAGAVKKILQSIGHNQFSIPLSGTFPANLMGYDLKTASQRIKSDLISGLSLTLPLPQNLKIPGMPNIVSVKSAQIIIIGREIKGTPKIFAGLTGDFGVKLHNAEKTFSFGMLAAQPGKAFTAEITGDSKDTVNLPFFHPLNLTNMHVVATKKAGKWDIVVNAKSNINTKKVDVAFHYVSNSGSSAVITAKTKLILSDLLPGDIPGLSEIELDSVEIMAKRLWLQGKVKGISTFMEVQKPLGSKGHFVALYLDNLSLSKLIPDTAKTPLKNAGISSLVALYSPQKQATKLSNLKFTGITASWVHKSNANPTIKPGMNIFGHMNIHPSGDMAKILKKVGVSDLKLPLGGGFSSKAFAKNTSGVAIKKAILDNLDIEVNLPKLKIPEVEKFLAFNNGKLAITSKTLAGKQGINVAISGDADLLVKGDKVAFKVDVDHSKSKLTFTATSDKKWTHPLGIKFLDLDTLSLGIGKKKGAYDITVTAKTDIGRHSRLNITVDLHEKNGQITDAFFELDGPMKLSEIPDVKGIPQASHFTINTIKISENGIEAKTDFGGKKDLDIFLFRDSGWNLLLRQDNFAITEFVPLLKNTPLKHIVLSETAMVLSKDGLQGALSSFSPIAQDALKDIYGKGPANIDVSPGLSLIAAFEQKKSGGGLAKAFKRLGLSEERVIMTGDIGGLFGGPTKLNVDVDLSAHSGAKGQPKWMKSKPGVTAVFSMIATESAGQFDIEIGIGADIIATVHGTELLFDAKTALEFEDEKIGIKIVADLQDNKGWKNPFGIPGFTLYEVGMDLGIAEDGAIHLDFDGDIKASGDTFAIAADADLLPEALGAPQDIAFKGSADQVDMFFMEKIALAMIGGEFKVDIPAGILPTFTKVKFAFVTPGAQDPDLHITSEGFAMAGGMNWLDHQVGDMNVSISPTKGIQAAGKINDLNLGPLHLKKNDFKMDMGPKSVPSLTVDADVEMLGIKDKFHFDFNKDGIDIAATSDFGDLFKFKINADVSGKNLTKASGIKNADIFLDASLSSDPGAWLRNLGGASVKAKLNSIDAGAEKATQALNKAQVKVDGLDRKITAMKAKVSAEKRADEAKISAAIAKVNTIQNNINGFSNDMSRYQSEIKTCNQTERICVLWKPELGSCAKRIFGHCIWRHISMKCAKRETIPNIPERIQCEAENIKPRAELYFATSEKEGASLAKKGADWALSKARSAVAIIPTDLDPRVAGLMLAKQGATDALNLAKDGMKGITAFNNVIEKGVSVFKDTPNLFALKNSSIRGDLKKALKGQPVVLDMNAEIADKSLETRLAFSLTDPKFDGEQFGLIALGIAVDTVVKEARKIKIIPTSLLNDVSDLYTKEKKRIDAIIATAVTQNNIKGKPAVVDGPASSVANLVALQNKDAAVVTAQNDAALTALETKHKTDLAKFCSVSTANPRQERPIFDPCFYLKHNADLIKAFNTDFNKAATHWIKNGISEGRAASADFSLVAYVLRYPDLSKAFIKNEKIDFTAAMNHWLTNGKNEGRNPKPFACSATGGAKGMENAAFDPCFYINKYPDMKAAFHNNLTGATNHWLTFGIHEGRQSSAGFSTAAYIIRYEDLLKTFVKNGSVDFASAMGHWVNNGRKEGLNSKPFTACESAGGLSNLSTSTFDPCFYVNMYADLKSSFGYDSAKALIHWSAFGLKEGRQSSAGFDINAYVVRYPDLENTFIHSNSANVPGRYADYGSALDHWRNNGKKEGLNAKPFIGCEATGGVPELKKAVFDPCFYLNKYPDLKKAFGTRQELATRHWFAKGYSEGRQASAGFDLASYMLRYPDLTKKFITATNVNYAGAWEHWSTGGGQAEGLDPAPLGACGTTGGIASLAKAEFDPCFYLNKYPDLKNAFGDKWAYAAQHWMNHGIAEGRQSSAGFYLRDYMLRYDDLRRSFMQPIAGVLKAEKAIKSTFNRFGGGGSHSSNTGTSDLMVDYTRAWEHWSTGGGKAEGLNPAPLEACGSTGGIAELSNNVLDVCFYMNKHPDLKQVMGGDILASAAHWENYGYRESRVSSESFSLAAYLARNPDLQNVFIKKEGINYNGALGHWFTNGSKEGRKHEPLNCNGPQGSDPSLKGEVLDPCFYLNKYPDLKKAYGDNYEKAIQHWMFTGINEGRYPNVLSASQIKLEQLGLTWSDAGRVGGKPTCVAWNENADPNAWGDNYLCMNKDIGMRFNSAGPIGGMRCTSVNEGADPDSWHDNYVCVPQNSSWVVNWHAAGKPSGVKCVQITEGDEPKNHTWNDNFLCLEYRN